MRNIPIRLSVISIFFVIVSVMFSILYLVQTHFSEEFARKSIKTEFHAAANEIEEKMKSTNDSSQALLKTSSLFVEITDSQSLAMFGKFVETQCITYPS